VEIDHDLFERLVGTAEQELAVVALDPGGVFTVLTNGPSRFPESSRPASSTSK
jgi:hypothetical protein